ncbi:MAG TPA: thioredoxin domain-containing protein [Solirubrobacterales bacterium]|nr:thioredoxin domain-containing protein [Solirubrobacterales bacterium]
MSEAAVRAMPRRGRLWVIALLSLGLVALAYSIVEISTKKADTGIVHVAGISEAQEIFGGIPQAGQRLGSSDAPVTAEVFNDLQCSNCRDAFLATIPALSERYARSGEVKFLYRHYSNSENPQQLGFYGAEAAAEQGYGWQYTYLFFRNQEEAEKFSSEKAFENFQQSIAGSIGELDLPEWEKDLEEKGAPGGPIDTRLETNEELGRNLGIRVGGGMVITGPGGTTTLQEGPSLSEVEAAIAEVE